MLTWVMLGLGVAWSPLLWAQSLTPRPDAGSIERDILRNIVPSAPIQPQPIEVPKTEVPASGGVTFKIKRFDVSGIKVMDKATVEVTLASWTDREIDLAELRRVIPAIEAVYQQEGWLARVSIPPQDIVDGVVRLEITEGLMGHLEISEPKALPISARRIEKTLAQGYVEQEPLNLIALEGALYILQTLPGVSADAALKASSAPNSTDVVATVKPGPAINGSAYVDNWGSTQTGALRGSVNLNWNNPTASGDQVATNLMATEGLRYGRLAFSLPVGYSGDRVGASYSQMYYTLLGTSGGLPGSGNAQVFGLDWSRPLFFSREAKFGAFAQLNRSQYSDFNGPELTKRVVQTGTLGLSGEWASSSKTTLFWRMGWAMGDVDLSPSVVNQALDETGLRTEGFFQKLTANLTLVHSLDKLGQLWFTVNGQQSNKNLDSSERMPLGGPMAVRAYPSSEAPGDDAVTASFEWRVPVSERIQLGAFYDWGTVRLNTSPVLGVRDSPNRYNLSGWGASVTFQVTPSTMFKASVARRIGPNPGSRLSEAGRLVDNDGSYQDTRVWVNLSHAF